MRADLRLRSPKLFKQIYAEGKTAHGPEIVLRYQFLDQQGPTKSGFSISRKVGNAVTRNKIKRRLRAILMELSESIKPGFLLVFIVRPVAVGSSFEGLRAATTTLLRRADVLRAEA